MSAIRRGSLRVAVSVVAHLLMGLASHGQPFSKALPYGQPRLRLAESEYIHPSDAVLSIVLSCAGACLLSRGFHLRLQTMRFHPLYFLFCLSLLNYFNYGVSICSLDPSGPIYLPITNVTLPEQVQKRGIALSVGTPEQTLAFTVTGLDLCFFLQEERLKLTLRRVLDNTGLYYNSRDCSVPEIDSRILPFCSATAGGIWHKERSSSWLQTFSSDALQSAPESFPDKFDKLIGIETIRIGSSLPLSNFPVILSPSLLGGQNILGLARNSTLLNRLSSDGLIASRAWGYYQGWTGAETQHQLDGSLVLGGYDEAKTIGKNASFFFGGEGTCNSGLSFTISDIKMNFLNGTHVSIIDPSPGSAMGACLSFSYPLVSLPVDMWNSFVQFSEVNVLGRALGANNEAMLISGNRSLVFPY